jgi:hypothetical protein
MLTVFLSGVNADLARSLVVYRHGRVCSLASRSGLRERPQRPFRDCDSRPPNPSIDRRRGYQTFMSHKLYFQVIKLRREGRLDDKITSQSWLRFPLSSIEFSRLEILLERRDSLSGYTRQGSILIFFGLRNTEKKYTLAKNIKNIKRSQLQSL